MNPRSTFCSPKAALITIGLLVCNSHAATVTVGHDRITPTANVPSSSPEFPIAQIADGITNETNPSGLNGFASASFGIITLTFDQAYDLGSFLLWNDVNLDGSTSEGIDQFTLSFFDILGNPISTPAATTYTAPVEQLQAAEYVFANPIPGVRSVDLEVLSSQWAGWTRIEIREVDFGVVPEPSSAAILTLSSLGLLFRRRHR